VETHIVRFVPHGLDSPEVQARMAAGDAIAIERMERINLRLAPHIARFNAGLSALVRNQRSADYCVPKFWALIDEMMSFNAPDVACKRGCNHCCHTQVLVTDVEAAVIGRRIGIKPRPIIGRGRNREDTKNFDWGYHNPCTFLVNGECSIYENRPMPCRTQYNLDIDALMCELTPPESKTVLYMNPHPFLMAFLQMLGVPHVVPKLADIREFFPRS
jgi:hypothetical protein